MPVCGRSDRCMKAVNDCLPDEANLKKVCNFAGPQSADSEHPDRGDMTLFI